MSTSAYRVFPTVSKSPTLNVWYDKKLVSFLDKEANFHCDLDDFGSGFTVVPLNVLETAVKLKEELDLNEDNFDQLRLDIADAKFNNNTTVTYECI